MTVQAADCNDLTPFGVAADRDRRGRIELAHAIGIDPTTLWRWMTGRSRPQSEAMRRQAATALGRSVEELWPGHGSDSTITSADADDADRHEEETAA